MANWLSTIVRVAGSGFALTAPLVTLQSERDARELQNRLNRLEDPLSSMHEDVRPVSSAIYAMVRETNDSNLKPPREFYERYSRVLALLEGQGAIHGSHGIGERFAAGFWVADPNYIMYMAALFEDPDKMDFLVRYVDQATSWVDGKKVASELRLPVPVAKAVFDLYELRGLGLCSREIGSAMYRPFA